MDTITIIIIIISAVAVALALGVLIYWYAFIFEVRNFKLSEIKVYLKSQVEKNTEEDIETHKTHIQKKWLQEIATGDTSSLQELSVLHLSDFHIRKDAKGQKLFEFICRLRSITPVPDFIFITGDIVEKNENFPFLFKMLEGLKASYGRFAVFGVHDYFNKTPKEFLKNMIKKKKEYKRPNDVTALIEKLESLGIKVLRNENTTLSLAREGASEGRINNIEIIGVEDSIIKRTDIAKAFAGLENSGESDNKSNDKKPDTGDPYKCRIVESSVSARNNITIHTLNTEGTLRIVLTHTPDMELLSALSRKNVDMVVAGHTHGGQVRLPWIGALISGCNIKTKYCSGLFHFHNFILYITRGLGEGRYSPFRFYCQPEATLIKFYYNKIDSPKIK